MIVYKGDTGRRRMPVSLILSFYGCEVGNKLHSIVCWGSSIEVALGIYLGVRNGVRGYL